MKKGIILFLAILLISCYQKKTESNYSYITNCKKVTIFTFPNLYILEENKLTKILKIKNHVQILGFSDRFVYVNEVVTPYKKNRIHIYDTENNISYNKVVKNIEYLLYGGYISSYRISESNNKILIKINGKNKICITKHNLEDCNFILNKNESFKKILNTCEKIKIEHTKSNKKHHIKIGDKIYTIPIQIIPVIDEN